MVLGHKFTTANPVQSRQLTVHHPKAKTCNDRARSNLNLKLPKYLVVRKYLRAKGLKCFEGSGVNCGTFNLVTYARASIIVHYGREKIGNCEFLLLPDKLL